MSSMTLERSIASRESTVTGTGSRGSHPSAPRSILSSAKSWTDAKSVVSAHEGKKKKKNDANPFKIPPDVDIFQIRDQEREKKQMEKERNKHLKVHQKTTYNTRMNAEIGRLRKEIEDEEMEEMGAEVDKALDLQENASWKLAVIRDRNVQRESLNDYINKKREMFRLEYGLQVKRDEIQKLETMAATEEQKLEKAEQFLEQDAIRFDEFLKENDRNSVEAMKQADKETKLKLERAAEIKGLTAQMMNIKSDIAKSEEILREYLMYKEFLFRLSPKEWQEQRLKKKENESKKQREPLISREKEKSSSGSHKVSASPMLGKKPESRSSGPLASRDSFRDIRQPSRSSLKTVASKKMSSTIVLEDDNSSENLVSSDSEEEPELYFTDPQQLLNIFSEMEERNLSLIQNSQETEQALEEIKHTITMTEKKMENETQQLKAQIAHLQQAVVQEDERAVDLEMKCRVFAFGQYSFEEQEKMLTSLTKKVGEVYQACIKENRANLNALQMLTMMEQQVEELLDNIETIPKERLETAEKAKEKERRLRLRDEKIKQQKLHQEERLRRALERAQADPKKTTGRKLMTRSDPPAMKPKIEKDQDADKEKEEALYFFR
ncbi:cilia- and flagella-associated protein 100 [Bufo gargarizans]|uniref:cilia- and flagella-associated protein 100 n=1 Tax=Bufo gargarizans TaxID=30331 RepID=UPI001CF5B1CE|nr:cilia- and flagella-associated protein 100 [Bufo gargarizans]XP_044157832.1 cilia- and flagella-associated protein 100 [Bufo gargarizans]